MLDKDDHLKELLGNRGMFELGVKLFLKVSPPSSSVKFGFDTDSTN